MWAWSYLRPGKIGVVGEEARHLAIPGVADPGLEPAVAAEFEADQGNLRSLPR
jgi:hypothetical protein